MEVITILSGGLQIRSKGQRTRRNVPGGENMATVKVAQVGRLSKRGSKWATLQMERRAIGDEEKKGTRTSQKVEGGMIRKEEKR